MCSDAIWRSGATAALGLVLSFTPGLRTLAQPAGPAAPAGHWTGEIDVPSQKLGVEVDLFAKADGAWAGTITIPAQNLRGFPLAAIEVKGGSVGFAMKGVPGEPTFKGRLWEDGVTLSGEFTQGEAHLPFKLKRTGDAVVAEAPASTPIGPELVGNWEGTLDAGGQTLRLKLELKNEKDGKGAGRMVSVDQGGAEIPLSSVTQAGARLDLKLVTIGGAYTAELKEGRLVGTWTQGRGSFPLVLARVKP